MLVNTFKILVVLEELLSLLKTCPLMNVVGPLKSPSPFTYIRSSGTKLVWSCPREPYCNPSLFYTRFVYEKGGISYSGIHIYLYYLNMSIVAPEACVWGMEFEPERWFWLSSLTTCSLVTPVVHRIFSNHLSHFESLDFYQLSLLSVSQVSNP